MDAFRRDSARPDALKPAHADTKGADMPRPIEINDLGNIRYVGDPQISPDGSVVAYVVTEADIPGKTYHSSIWLAASDGSWERRFTNSTAKDTSPRWSPDGRRLAFLSDRSSIPQLYVIPVNGGEPQMLTDLKYSVAEPAWSPDGTWIAVTSKVGPEGMVIRSEQTAQDRQRENEQSDVKVIRTLKYKLDGEGFLGELKRHIFLVSPDGGRPTQLTDGDWDDTNPSWSPDSTRVAFASNRTEDREFSRKSDIWIASVADTSTARVTGSDGQYVTPAFSPDGTLIAYAGNAFSEHFGPNTVSGLWVQFVRGGETRNIASKIDRDIGGSAISDAHYVAPAQFPVWAGDGLAVYASYADRGSVSIGQFGLDEESACVITGEREVLNFSRARNGRMALLISDSTHPFEVFVSESDGSSLRQVSHRNAELLEAVSINHPISLVVTSADGTELDTWLLTPPGFDETKKYPLILEIHGGPHAMYGHTFYHELHVYAARGYLVLYCNPRGSTGSGQQFVNAAAGDWGGTDYADLMQVVDHVARLPYVDSTRMGVTGGSYGGYMTNWIITQTDRFKAAVTQRSTCNRHNLYGTSDMVWSYASWEFGGTAYERPEFYLERSPLTYIKNVTAPVLIMHSENDYRCPIEQAEQFFVALKLHGKQTEFIRFPNESHGLSRTGRPDHRVERLQRAIDWFDRYV